MTEQSPGTPAQPPLSTPPVPPPVGPWTTAPAPAQPTSPPHAPGDGRRWRTWQLLASAVVSLLVGVGIGAATTEEPADGGDSTERAARSDRERGDDRDRDDARSTTSRPPRTAPSGPPRTTTTALPEEGTRANPFPLGTPLVTDSGIEVTINHVDFDAAAAIAAENMFNDPAPEGMRYALVNLTITNTGDEPIDTIFAVSVSMIGSANRLYDGANASCAAVVPNELYEGGQLFTGGSYTGNECLLVPEAEVADGSLLVGVAPTFGDPVFVRLS